MKQTRRQKKHHLRKAIQAFYAQQTRPFGPYSIVSNETVQVFLYKGESIIVWDLKSAMLQAPLPALKRRENLINLILLRVGRKVSQCTIQVADKYGRGTHPEPGVRVTGGEPARGHQERNEWPYSLFRPDGLFWLCDMPTNVYERLVLLDRGPPCP